MRTGKVLWQNRDYRIVGVPATHGSGHHVIEQLRKDATGADAWVSIDSYRPSDRPWMELLLPDTGA